MNQFFDLKKCVVNAVNTVCIYQIIECSGWALTLQHLGIDYNNEQLKI